MGNISADFTYGLMVSVAKRIATLRQTDPAQADADIQAHVCSMSEDEKQEFAEMIIHFAIKLSGRNS